jgi:hypothetical protein
VRSPRLSSALALLAAAACLAAVPSQATADADPPSDVLLLEDVYLPFTPQVSVSLANTLIKVVKTSKRAGYPIRVAIVASGTDLGAVPDIFNKPQQYAKFLGSEIDFKNHRPLLILMPAGLATHNIDAKAAEAIRGVKIGGGQRSDAMARAAIEAVPKLATAAGHPVAAVKIPEATGGGTRGTKKSSNALLVFIGPVVVVVLAALGAALIGRRRRAAEEREADA